MCFTKAFNTHWKNYESGNLALKEQQYQIMKAKDTGSENEIVDYSRAPCLGADQKSTGAMGTRLEKSSTPTGVVAAPTRLL